jgi:UDP-glucose:(heptosyl)LPS alpha-1,3-glucosyltransferase
MKSAQEKIKDFVEPQAFDEVQNFGSDPARVLAAYRFTDATSDLLARLLDALADLPRTRGAARALAGLRGAARAELGCQPRDMLFLFVGSGFARKGLGAAIEALRLVDHRSYWLLVVGKDREAARFMAQAAPLGDRVRFLGARDDVRALYAAADCLILPTRYDPFPNTVLEALAMALPAIVSTQCGAAEIIEPGVNGWLCQADDPAGLARLLRGADEAIRHPELSAAARASVERFSLDAMAGRLSALYQRLAAEAA